MGRQARGQSKPDPIKAAMTQDLYERFLYLWQNHPMAKQVTRQDFAAQLIALGLEVWEQRIPHPGEDEKKEYRSHEQAQ